MLQFDDTVLFLDIEMEMISLKGSDISEWVVSNPHKRLFRGGFLNLLLCLFYILLLQIQLWGWLEDLQFSIEIIKPHYL